MAAFDPYSEICKRYLTISTSPGKGTQTDSILGSYFSASCNARFLKSSIVENILNFTFFGVVFLSRIPNDYYEHCNIGEPIGQFQVQHFLA